MESDALFPVAPPAPTGGAVAGVPAARERGYGAGRFSFNVKGGRCEACQGDGVIRVEMHFLPDIYVPCDVCHSKRYNRETLEIQYKGKNIYDVLQMTVQQAHHFFAAIPAIERKLGNNSIVLMRGHGCTVTGVSIEDAVMSSVYLQVNAQLQMDAMRLGPVTFLNDGEIDIIVKARADGPGDGRAWEYMRARSKK